MIKYTNLIKLHNKSIIECDKQIRKKSGIIKHFKKVFEGTTNDEKKKNDCVKKITECESEIRSIESKKHQYMKELTKLMTNEDEYIDDLLCDKWKTI